MFWFRRNRRRPPEERDVPAIIFIGEQVGPPENVLKARLAEFFRRDQSVTKAYLAKVSFGDTSVGVALCLRTLFGPDKGMVEKIGTVFASVFNTHEHLDIVFLSDDQEASLVRVCQPFFLKDC